MAAPAHLDPSPFFLPAGSTGILLLHGFTGAPPEMRRVGDYFHASGLTVSAPLLPGHGTTIEDINRRKWTDWLDHAERSYAELCGRCERVFVAGLSMGSLLTLLLAARHPELAGAIAYSPATWIADPLLPLAAVGRHLIQARPKRVYSRMVDPQAEKLVWCYDRRPVPAAAELYALCRQARSALPALASPLLIVYSALDRSIHPASAERTYALAGSKDKKLIRLEESGHAITVDRQWRFVADETLAWVRQHGG